MFHGNSFRAVGHEPDFRVVCRHRVMIPAIWLQGVEFLRHLMGWIGLVPPMTIADTDASR
jgi:hypothetical protein